MARQGTYAKGTARRLEILQAARNVLAQEGYRNTSLRSIARSLSMEPAHILYYFGSRENLLREVLEEWDNRTGADFQSGDAPDLLALFTKAIRHNLQIPGIVHTYLTFAAEAVDASHPAHDYFKERFARTRELLSDSIRSGQQTGQIRSELDPDRTARMLIAIADGLQLQGLIDPSIDAPADLEAAINDLHVHQAAAVS